MKPIRREPALVYDGAGRLITRISVDPVTGKRTREVVTE